MDGAYYSETQVLLYSGGCSKYIFGTITLNFTLFPPPISSVCCRSPIIPVRPTYSAELLSASFSGSLPRSAGATGSAPDLSHHQGAGTSSPVTNVWTNPLNVSASSSSSSSNNQAHHQHHQHHPMHQHESAAVMQQMQQQPSFNSTSVSGFGVTYIVFFCVRCA